MDCNKEEQADSYSEADGSLRRNAELSMHEVQRLQVAKELLETERKYCGTLWTISDTFAQPLRNTGILSNKDINTLFPEEVQHLYEQHCTLLHQLEERIANWSHQPAVGDLLARFTDPFGTNVLRLYTNYVNDFPEVLKTFHKLCRTSTEFTQFLKGCIDHPNCGGLDLGAFLLTPVQRMPRYILLLKQMLKFTDSSHRDYAAIHQCLGRLRDYLGRLNDSMEHSFQLVAAQIGNQQSEQHQDSRRQKSNKRSSALCSNILSTNFSKSSQYRGSLTVSESSDSTVPLEAVSMNNNTTSCCGIQKSTKHCKSNGCSNNSTTRYPVPAPRSRSTSVPRPVFSNQTQNINNLNDGSKKGDNYSCIGNGASSGNRKSQLKTRSMSTTWVETDDNHCSCKDLYNTSRHRSSNQQICSFIDSDSDDDESCGEEYSVKNNNNTQCTKPTFQSSKSLHDIQQASQSNLVTMASEEIVCSEPSLGENASPRLRRPGSRQGLEGINIQSSNLRPLSSAHSTCHVDTKSVKHKEYFATVVTRNSWNPDSDGRVNFSAASSSKHDGKSKKQKSSSNKKRISFKASLKNILTPFKKRGSSRTLHGTDPSFENLPRSKTNTPSPYPSMFYCDLENSVASNKTNSLSQYSEKEKE